MEGRVERRWMYCRRNLIGREISISREFIDGVEQFDKFAKLQEEYVITNTYRCPCRECKNISYLNSDLVKRHLYKNGFVDGYWYWTCHGEFEPHYQDHGQYQQGETSNFQMHGSGSSVIEHDNHMQSMMYDAYEANEVNMSDNPTASAANFYEMLSSSQEALYEGCIEKCAMSELDLEVRLLSVKSDHNLSQSTLNDFIAILKDALPQNSRIPNNWLALMRRIKSLGLDVQSIDCCINGCMLYYKDNEVLEVCKFCKHARRKPVTKRNRKNIGAPFVKMQYLPLTPRLQRLYTSKNTAQHMRWHYEHPVEEGVLRHPRDGEAWKHSDTTYPDFAQEPRNVRLGLCADGFTPFSNIAKPYSVWPIVLTPYNLPPSMCMTTPYMFLTCMIPGPKSPGNNIDVYLEPLIDELKVLWAEGVETYDISSKTNFRMRAKLVWTVNDFPAYGMLSGWSTHGRLSCPVCMDQNPGRTLAHGGKSSWFDCHRCFLEKDHPYRKKLKLFRKGVKVLNYPPPQRYTGEEIWTCVCDYRQVTTDQSNVPIPGFGKEHNWTKRSIFWELPYWKDNKLRHNLDVMHIEKNFCDNITDTVLDNTRKTKDNLKARMDMELLCDRNELNLVPIGINKFRKPKATFVLSPQQKKACCEWLKHIQLPDGYCSNFANCVDASSSKLQNMKSHDNHVFLETLLPVAFSALPEAVLGPLVELSEFFRNLCSSELHMEQLEEMSTNISLIICKLETFFPPGFWNVMEHLPVHLAEEAMLGGPVHYRWMYPFERFFGWLKSKCTQKSHPEVTMVNAYLHFEISKFVSIYFDKSIPCVRTRTSRNQVPFDHISRSAVHTLSVFHTKGMVLGHDRKRHWFEGEDRSVLHLHVLLNCEEVQPYIENFKDIHIQQNPDITSTTLDQLIEKNFADWFGNQVGHNTIFNDEKQMYLMQLSQGPSSVKYYSGYKGDGVRFQTSTRCEGKKTDNSGVVVKGTCEGDSIYEYYGTVEDILQVEYPGEPIKIVTLFKCRWFNPYTGVKYPKLCPFPEINHRSKLNKYDPFILADTATQIFYVKYPAGVVKRVGDWRIAIPNKLRGNPTGEDAITLAFQEDYMTTMHVDPLVETTLVDRDTQNNDYEDVILEVGDDEEEEEIVEEEEEEEEVEDEDTNDDE